MSITLTQRMSTAIAKFDFEPAIRGIRARSSARRVFRTAMAQAYTTVGRHYRPRWASYLLDREFQASCEPRLRACYLEGQPCMTPVELAHFWAGQLQWFSEEARVQHVAELVDVADRFLRCLEQELREEGMLLRQYSRR